MDAHSFTFNDDEITRIYAFSNPTISLHHFFNIIIKFIKIAIPATRNNIT